MSEESTILVTGATGFIGGWIVETLHLRNRASVRAGIKNWSSAARLGRFPINVVFCDVMDKTQIIEAMSGITHVIHCAVGSGDTIVQGTENMLEAALKAKIKRFVHLSTTEVYGNVEGRIDETFPFHQTGMEYADSKIEAEKACWSYFEKGLPVTTIRPSIVYGPFGTDWTIGIANKLKSGNWGIFEGYGDGICNLIYIADLVDGILLTIQHQNAVGEAFNFVGPNVVTWNQYFQMFNQIMGLPKLEVIDPGISKVRATIKKPAKSLAMFAREHLGSSIQKIYEGFREARRAMSFIEMEIRTTPSLQELNLYSRQAYYMTSKAKRLLGYNPIFDISTGLKISIRWLNHLGIISEDSIFEEC